jgi:hypothetical protein
VLKGDINNNPPIPYHKMDSSFLSENLFFPNREIVTLRFDMPGNGIILCADEKGYFCDVFYQIESISYSSIATIINYFLCLYHGLIYIRALAFVVNCVKVQIDKNTTPLLKMEANLNAKQFILRNTRLTSF